MYAHITMLCTVKKDYEIPGFFYQTFLGLEFGKLFPAMESLVSDIPAMESLVSDIPAGDGKSLNLYLECVRYDFALAATARQNRHPAQTMQTVLSTWEVETVPVRTVPVKRVRVQTTPAWT